MSSWNTSGSSGSNNNNNNNKNNNGKKLSSREMEILNRQRALANARRQQQQQQQQPPPLQPPPPPRRPSSSNYQRPKKSISELLAPSSSKSSLSSSLSSSRVRSRSQTQTQNQNNNKAQNQTQIRNQIRNRSRSRSGSINNNNNNNSIDISNNANNNNAKKKRNGQEIIDLTSSSSPSSISTAKTASATTTTMTATTKRPTKRPRINTRPSNLTVEKAISASRSRVQVKEQSQGGASASASASISSSASSGGTGGGLSSLLMQAGITEQQLQKKIKIVNQETSDYDNTMRANSKYNYSNSNSNSNNHGYGHGHKRRNATGGNHSHNHDDGTMTMDLYFNAIREWDFLSALNDERRNSNANTRAKTNANSNAKTNANANFNDNQQRSNEESISISIPDAFKSGRQYQNLWTPLCLEEAKAQILSDALGDVPRWTNNGNGNGRNNHNNNSNNNNRNNNNSAISLIPILATPHTKDVGSNNPNMTIIVQKQKEDQSSSLPSYHSYNNNNNNNNNNRSTSFMSNDLVVLAKTKSVFMQASKGKLFDNKNNNKNNNNNNSNSNSNSNKNNNNNSSAGTETTRKIMGCIGVVEYGRKTIDGLQIKISRTKWIQLVSSKNDSNLNHNNYNRNGKGGKKEEEMVLLKLGCNVTNMREFSALCRIGTLPLLPYLLCKKMTRAKDSLDELSEVLSSGDIGDIIKKSNSSSSSGSNNNISSSSSSSTLIDNMGGKVELGQGFINYAKGKFNSSQLGAISAAASEYGHGGFTLVKGPPGTGKTTTLVALLNALHIRQMNKYYDKVKEIVNVDNTKSTGAKRVALEEAQKGMPRVLVCAPSNNAIDNVIRKIMDNGFIDGHGSRYNPSIVRIGSGQSATVRDVSLETKVENLMSEANDYPKVQSIISGFKSELSRIQTGIVQLKRRQIAIGDASTYPLSKDWEIRCDVNFDETNRVYFVNHKEKSTTYECPPPPEPGETQFPAKSMPEYRTATQQLVKLVHKFTSIKGKLDRYLLVQKACHSSASNTKGQKNIDVIKQQLETDILDSTHIVLTTLGTSGCRALESSDKFEVVVVDEAAQSVEPATLVALQLGSSHAILVGDPQQLPATIFSVSGRNTKYDRSLFQRLEEAGHEVHLLDTQYRMHPEVSEFPRKIFYGGYLKDGPNVRDTAYGNPLKELVRAKFPSFRPFSIFDVDSAEERGGTSLANSTEANFALHLYNSLVRETGHIATQSRVCIITPYSQQAAMLRRTFSQGLGQDYGRLVEVNTVDSFQGREANVIIFSCVRAAGSKGIGFLSDVRRMNVALTRAKYFLFVIARCQSIVVNPYWDQLVSHAREARAIIPVPVSGKSAFPDLSSLEPLKPIPKEMVPISRKKESNNSKETIDSDEDGEIGTL